MPVIRLDGVADDVNRVLAAMHFPDSDARQQQYCAVRRVQTEMLEGADSQMFSFSRKTVRLLIEAPAWEQLKIEAQKRAKAGIVAGDLLSALYIMDRFKLKPSLNRAIWVAQGYGKSTQFGDGTKYPRGEKQIRECWASFSCVAHLWGAWGLNRAYPYAPDREIFSKENFQKFLSVAAELLRFGTTFIPKGARPPLPILDSRRCFALPSHVHPSKLESKDLPDRLLQLLADYKAPMAYR